MTITSESGSFAISLPMSGVDITSFDQSTSLEVDVSDASSISYSLTHTLGDDPSYQPGRNHATFQEVDQNTGAAIGTTTLSWTATSITIKGSYTDKNGAVFGAESAFGTSGTAGTTAINDDVTVKLAFDAFATNRDLIVKGRNTDVETSDGGRNPISLETGSFAGSADFTPPTVTLTSPANGAKLNNSTVTMVNVAGRASDSAGLASIFVEVNGDPTTQVEMDLDPTLNTTTTNWSTQIDLTQLGGPGPYTISAFALDSAGNQSAPVSHSVVWIDAVNATVTVSPAGSGTITGLKNQQQINVGTAYKVTAKPASKYAFLNWTDDQGNVLSSSLTFEYVAASDDAALMANFVANPYPAVSGAYNGLFSDPDNGIAPSSAGFITVAVTTSGAYSGKLYLAGTPHSFSGTFSLPIDYTSGNYGATSGLSTIKVSSTETLTVALQLNVDPTLTDTGAGLITGNVSPADQSWNATVSAEWAHLVPGSVATGLYNFALSPVDAAGVAGPGGYSYGSATLTSKGAVTFALHLADDISPAISFPTTVGMDGAFPFYASLYKGQGLVMGWISLANAAPTTLQDAMLTWIKLPVATATPYAAGFSASDDGSGTFNLFGCPYVAPKKGTNILGWTYGSLTVTGANVGNSILAGVGYNPLKNTFTDSPANDTLALTTASGALSGKFVPATGAKAVAFSGVVFNAPPPVQPQLANDSLAINWLYPDTSTPSANSTGFPASLTVLAGGTTLNTGYNPNITIDVTGNQITIDFPQATAGTGSSGPPGSPDGAQDVGPNGETVTFNGLIVTDLTKNFASVTIEAVSGFGTNPATGASWLDSSRVWVSGNQLFVNFMGLPNDQDDPVILLDIGTAGNPQNTSSMGMGYGFFTGAGETGSIIVGPDSAGQ